MPIRIYTGLPGNGKTALMMEELLAEAKKATRPLVVVGVDGLKPGLAQVLDDGAKWNDKDLLGNHIVPDGSLIFVDEAWKTFGHLQDASRQATPKHVLALAEHRHRGIDFVWTTQQPSQIYPFARGLIAGHKHVVRKFGTRFMDVFEWQELCEDVKSQSRRDAAIMTTRTLPVEVFSQYQSAVEHTIKRKIPKRVYAIPLLILGAIACTAFAYHELKPSSMAARMAGKDPSAAQAAPGPQDRGLGIGEHRVVYANAGEFAAALTPRISTIPGSAPIFDSRSAQADPELYCMSSKGGTDGDGDQAAGGCHCVTEQGTPYALSKAECLMVARNGAPYNPFKKVKESNAMAQQQPAAGAGATRGDAPTTAVLHAPQIAAYGDIGISPNPSARPATASPPSAL